MLRWLTRPVARVEQRFEATTVVDVIQEGRVLVPAGSVVQGVVSRVERAGRLLDRKGSLPLAFDRIQIRGRDHTIAATDGKDVTSPAGSTVRLRMDPAVNLR